MKIKSCISAAVLAALLIPSTAMADPYYYPHREVRHSYDRDWHDHDREYHQRNESRPQRRDAGDYILPVIGGIILGAVLTSSSENQSRPVDQDEVYRQPAPRVYRYDRYCDCYR